MRVARVLVDAGIEARPYHAGLAPELRAETQDWWTASSAGIVVATIAFGMGIDKADVRYVYHYAQPKSLEAYAQETGRAGRDGAPSICEFFACPDDQATLENFIYGDTPARAGLDGLDPHRLRRGRYLRPGRERARDPSRRAPARAAHRAHLPRARRLPAPDDAVLRGLQDQAAQSDLDAVCAGLGPERGAFLRSRARTRQGGADLADARPAAGRRAIWARSARASRPRSTGSRARGTSS